MSQESTKTESVDTEKIMENNQTNLLFTEDKEQVKIESKGSKDKTSASVTIDQEIINRTLSYMRIKASAWDTMHKAFIHLSLVFKPRDFYGESELATEFNNYFEKAPFTVQNTKKALNDLAKLGILEVKTKKGKLKYAMTNLGLGIITHDKMLMALLGFDKPANINNNTTTADNSSKDGTSQQVTEATSQQVTEGKAVTETAQDTTTVRLEGNNPSKLGSGNNLSE